MKCAVGKCEESNSKKPTSRNTVHFYSFPKDPVQRELWLAFCNRKNTINAQNERICSLHFKKEDFERNMKLEMGLSNRRAPKLKPGAIPTIDTNVITDDIKAFTCEEKHTPMANEDSLQLHIKTLETKIDEMRQENDLLKMMKSQSAATIKNLSCQIQRLSITNTNLEKALKNLFTEGQIKKFKSGDKRQRLTSTDINQSITLYSTLLKNKNFPLHSVKTLQRWSEKIEEAKAIPEPKECKSPLPDERLV